MAGGPTSPILQQRVRCTQVTMAELWPGRRSGQASGRRNTKAPCEVCRTGPPHCLREEGYLQNQLPVTQVHWLPPQVQTWPAGRVQLLPVAGGLAGHALPPEHAQVPLLHVHCAAPYMQRIPESEVWPLIQLPDGCVAGHEPQSQSGLLP